MQFNKFLLTAVFVTAGIPCVAHGDALVRSATGDSTAVTAARDAFRTDIGGGTVAGSNGSFGGARREINWDGVPDTSAAPNSLAADFFNSTSPRGVVFTTAGTGFQVSADAVNTSSEPVEFGGATGHAGYPAQFAPFTAERLFTSLGSNTLDVNFFLPGTSTLATVTSFGAVFSDVDLTGPTTIEYFDQFNNSLGQFIVPGTSGAETFSFLGVTFTEGEKVAYVRITSGNAVLGTADTGSADAVVIDDFLYTEPSAQTTLGAIAVTAPNGGEALTVGASTSITWTPSLSSGTVNIELSRNGGTTWETLFAASADDGTESWTVSGPVTGQALVRVTSTLSSAVTDTSNAVFAISDSTSTLPDLRVSISNTRYRNGKFSGRITLSNSGPGASSAALVDLYVSSNSAVGTGDLLVLRRSVAGITAGSSRAFSFNVSASRNRRLIAVADPTDDVAESNEANNNASRSVR